METIIIDWDGTYVYESNQSIDSLKIYEELSLLSNAPKEPGQLLGSFVTTCSDCSYEIRIDWKNVVFKSIFNLDTLWKSKNNKLYKLNSNRTVNNKNRRIIYKKIDSFNVREPYINLFEKMKSAY